MTLNVKFVYVLSAILVLVANVPNWVAFSVLKSGMKEIIHVQVVDQKNIIKKLMKVKQINFKN